MALDMLKKDMREMQVLAEGMKKENEELARTKSNKDKYISVLLQEKHKMMGTLPKDGTSLSNIELHQSAVSTLYNSMNHKNTDSQCRIPNDR